MTYLLITHVPLFAGQSTGVVRATTPWAVDLRAATAALRNEGFDVHVASPLAAQIDKRTSERYSITELSPARDGFVHLPLPFPRTMPQFVAARASLRKALGAAMRGASIIQMGHGGHPVSMGALAWPIAGKSGRPRIWQFDASDPFPQLEKYTRAGHNPAKRVAKQMMLSRTLGACRQAIREADLVFCHRPQLAERFPELQSDRVAMLPWSGLAESTIASPAIIASRQDRLLKSKTIRLVHLLNGSVPRASEHLIRAVAKAARLGAAVALDLIGNQPDQPELMNLLREEKLDTITTLHGPTPTGATLNRILDRADIGLVSMQTGLPDEAHLLLARGLPLLGLGDGAVDRASDIGWFAPRGELNQLAQTILEKSRNRLQLAEFCQNARQSACSGSLEAVHARRAKWARELVERTKVRVA